MCFSPCIIFSAFCGKFVAVVYYCIIFDKVEIVIKVELTIIGRQKNVSLPFTIV